MRASYYLGQLTTPKSGKVRAVPLAHAVAAALAPLSQRQDWVSDDDLVFVGVASGYLDGPALRRRYKTALAVAGLRSLRFHDLRHTFGTQMIAKRAKNSSRSPRPGPRGLRFGQMLVYAAGP